MDLWNHKDSFDYGMMRGLIIQLRSSFVWKIDSLGEARIFDNTNIFELIIFLKRYCFGFRV